jgi:uncharacterized phage-associated protein
MPQREMLSKGLEKMGEMDYYVNIRGVAYMSDVIDVANYILEVSRDESPDGEYELISHMKLQKLVYFCQGYSLAFYGRPLFPEPIEAWTHGPVCPRLYHLLKVYGSLPITGSIDPDKIKLTEHEKYLVGMVYDSYGQYSASRLRKITHEEGPWKTTPADAPIPQNDMLKYFESLIEVTPANIPPSSENEKKELIKILEKAEADGEINLSRFCVPMGT